MLDENIDRRDHCSVDERSGFVNDVQVDPWSSVSRELLNKAFWLNLDYDTLSPVSQSLRDHLVNECVMHSSGKKLKATKKFTQAVGATLAGLMKSANKGRDRYSYRQMSAGSFSGQRIGYEVFKRASDNLKRLGFLEVVGGFGAEVGPGRATRFRATTKLFDLANRFGVDPVDWDAHFRALPRSMEIDEPLVLKSSSIHSKGKKEGGMSMPFDRSAPKPFALERQVRELNGYFAGVDIKPSTVHFGFRRVFNQGDVDGFDWNKGGRLYSLGDSYQQMKSRDRRLIRINGCAVVEIDIKSSHLTILHALKGVVLGSDERFYHVPGLPRGVVKSWVTMTLGHDRFQKAWSTEVRKKYNENDPKALQRDYPIRETRERILAHIPLLRGWPESAVRWGDLQYLESCSVVDAVYEMAIGHNIPALPVHDSIIVPVDHEAKAIKILSDSFEHHVGARPHLVSKFGD